MSTMYNTRKYSLTNPNPPITPPPPPPPRPATLLFRPQDEESLGRNSQTGLLHVLQGKLTNRETPMKLIIRGKNWVDLAIQKVVRR